MKRNRSGKPEIISMQAFDVNCPAWEFGIIDKDEELLKSNNGLPRIMTMDEAVRVLGEWEERARTPANSDIFDNLNRFKITKTIYIVAPGKNGRDFYKYIPENQYTIVVNKAIKCPVKANLWLVADSGAPRLEWFQWGIQARRDILCLADGYFKGIESPYTFRVDDPPMQITDGDARIFPGKLRTGGTITAMAMQLAAQLKPDKIVLCGVDMKGDEYFDGERVKLYETEGRNKEWPVIGRIVKLIEEIEERGIKVETLSPTLLPIRKIPRAELKVPCQGVNILECGFNFNGGDVYIVGTGPNGRAHYGDIPNDARVIVVNKAIDIAGIPKSIWMCEDGTLPDKDWFIESALKLCQRKYTVADLANPNLTVPVFADSPGMNDYGASFCFEHHGFIGGAASPDGTLRPGKLYGGATVACRALQMAFQLGARRIFLIGIDMAGNEYFDGSKGDPKFRERLNGGLWDQRRAFDLVLKWLDKNTECEVYSLSDTALTVTKIHELEKLDVKPKSEQPTIAYMSMCKNPMMVMQIAAWCMAQDYPQELKTLYLIHQPPFPEPIRHDLPIKIVELFVNHPWPAGWAFKIKAFSDTATEDIMIHFDQDDCWMPDYTRKAIAPLIAGAGLAWNYHMWHVVNRTVIGGEFVDIPWENKVPDNATWTPTALYGKHQSPIGTLVAWMDKFRIIVDDLMAEYPEGLAWNEIVKCMAGPIDNYFKKLIMKKYNHWLANHEADGRIYFIHTGASSKWHRRKEAYIDVPTQKKSDA